LAFNVAKHVITKYIEELDKCYGKDSNKDQDLVEYNKAKFEQTLLHIEDLYTKSNIDIE